MSVLTRRQVLSGAGGVAALGLLAGSRRAAAAEASATESALCLSMLYPGGKGKFDADRYRDKHLPLIRGIYGDSVDRIELRVAPPPAKRVQSRFPAPPAAFLAAVNIWIRRIDEYGRHTAESAQQIQSDLLKVSEIVPYVQYDQMLSHTGQSRADVTVGTEVASTYYPNKDGGRWDAKYFIETYLPKVLETYGADSLLRTEVTQGRAGQNGAKAAVTASSHLFIRDRAAFDAAGRKAMTLFQDTPNFTDIMGVFTFMKVHAAG
jgi:hypothetical protein